MGTDIYMCVEYREPGQKRWHCMGDDVRFVRIYELFGLLCDGVRGYTYPESIPCRSPVDDLSVWAEQYDVGYRFTYCTPDEFRDACAVFENEYSTIAYDRDYQRVKMRVLDVAALAARGGNDVRLVYCFD